MPLQSLIRRPEGANIRAAEGSGTTTLANRDQRWQVFNLSAARTVVLPSDIEAGDAWRIDNVGTGLLTLQSSNLSTIAAFNTGSVEVSPLVAGATTAANWSRSNLIEATDFSNHWINGGFDVWQKQFTFTGVTDGLLTADRLRAYKNGTMVYDINRDTSDFPTFAQAGFQFAASLRVNITTAQASVTGNNRIMLGYAIEGHDYQKFHGGRFITVQFWVKLNVVGTYSVGLQSTNQDRSYHANFTISSGESGNWVKKTVVLVTDNTGTYNFTTGAGLFINIVLASGSTYQGTDNTWTATGQNLSSTSQANFASSTSNVARFTGFMIIDGDATNYDVRFRRCGRNIQDETAMCHRYFYQPNSDMISNFNANPAQVGSGVATSTTQAQVTIPFPTRMRTRPTLTFSGSGNFLNGIVTVQCTSAVIYGAGHDSTSVIPTVASGLTAGHGYALYQGATGALMQFDAEI